MADDVDQIIESAFETLLNVTEESKNLRHDLKQDIVKAVSKLRSAISKMKNGLTQKDNDLNKLRAEYNNAQDLHQARNHRVASQMIPTATELRWPEPSVAQKRNYSAVVSGTQEASRPKTFKLMVKSKANQSVEYMKTLIKTKVNPVEIKVGISSIKGLKNGQLLIESANKTEADIICKNINDKCGGEVEANITKLRNPKIIIFNVSEEITVDNVVEAITTQNEEMKEHEKELQPKFEFEDRRKNRNIVIEVSSGARNKILGRKLKIGWHICNWDDYVRVSRCFKCCKYNHRAQDCKGIQTCPKCSQNHSLKECKAKEEDYKCVNCCNYKKYNNDNTINENHSALDANCHCHQIAIKRLQQNTDY